MKLNCAALLVDRLAVGVAASLPVFRSLVLSQESRYRVLPVSPSTYFTATLLTVRLTSSTVSLAELSPTTPFHMPVPVLVPAINVVTEGIAMVVPLAFTATV